MKIRVGSENIDYLNEASKRLEVSITQILNIIILKSSDQGVVVNEEDVKKYRQKA